MLHAYCFARVSNLVPYTTGTVFDNMLLRKVFLCGLTTGTKKKKKKKKPIIMRNEQLHDSYYSTNIIRMNKSTRMRWTGDAARMMGEMSCYRNLKGK